jgi:hypothetical protein
MGTFAKIDITDLFQQTAQEKVSRLAEDRQKGISVKKSIFPSSKGKKQAPFVVIATEIV